MQSRAPARKRPCRTRPLFLLYRNTEAVEEQQIATAILSVLFRNNRAIRFTAIFLKSEGLHTKFTNACYTICRVCYPCGGMMPQRILIVDDERKLVQGLV